MNDASISTIEERVGEDINVISAVGLLLVVRSEDDWLFRASEDMSRKGEEEPLEKRVDNKSITETVQHISNHIKSHDVEHDKRSQG